MRPWRRSSSIILYFMLNLFVTITNKLILGARTQRRIQRPYLLTALHGSASLVGCTVANSSILHHIYELTSVHRVRDTSISWKQHGFLALFSLFYTINISLSNLSLSLVSLRLNQNIRAAAPVLTLIVSTVVLGQSLRTYSIATRISLVLISGGVILAASGHPQPIVIDTPLESQHDLENDLRSIGIFITLISALTAVLKTILTHKLMTSLSLNLSPLKLLHILTPYAVVQALVFAYLNGELKLPSSDSQSVPQLPNNVPVPLTTKTHLEAIRHSNCNLLRILQESRVTLWTANASAAFMLNIASFEANKSCGPISMAVAANLKQIVLLILPVVVASTSNAVMENEGTTFSIVFGTILTVFGGTWYAWELAKTKERTRSPPSVPIAADETGGRSLMEK